MQIFVAQKGQQLGPFTPAEVQGGLAAGRFAPADLGWHSGLSGWTPLAQFIAAAPGLSQPDPSAIPSPLVPAPFGSAPVAKDPYSNPYAYDSAAPTAKRPTTGPKWSGIALTSFLIGVIGVPAWVVVVGICAAAVGSGATEESPVLIFAGLGMFALIAVNLLGGGLGIAGSCMNISNKWMAIAGTILNGLEIAAFIGLIILGSLQS